MLAAVMGVPVLLIAGWGYWHVSSHAAVHVSFYDLALKNDRQAYGSVPAADVVFRDATGSILATGRADEPWGVISLLHPEVGDCRRQEREGGTAWRECFDAHSRWLMTWMPRVRHASVTVGTCRIDRMPVEVERSRDAWWLWWVPTPHIDNSTYTHFQLTMWIDSAACRPAPAFR
jgi:hypothetical protein